jgi:hypothetical protein
MDTGDICRYIMNIYIYIHMYIYTYMNHMCKCMLKTWLIIFFGSGLQTTHEVFSLATEHHDFPYDFPMKSI